MPPTAKDLDMTTSSSQIPGTSTLSGGRQSADNAGKPQPVPLEVPVTVNGVRTVAGSDKREPFSEATQTVLVFGNGTVIRLASMVTPGQLLFLTNDKTKKEVVCQVLKSKNYSNVSGYVELEFTEAVPGFWGMWFPGDRPMVLPRAPTPGAVRSSIAPPASHPKVEAPAPSNLPKRLESQPVPLPPARTETVATSVLKTGVKLPLNLPRAANSNPATAQPKAPAVPNSIGSSVTTNPRAPEIKPSAPVVPKAPPAPAAPVNAQTDALQRESARLQEQLSSMFFTPEVPAKSAPPASATQAVNRPASADSAAKVTEMAKSQPPAAKGIPQFKSGPVGMGPTLDVEEVKIPSWLEPLTRNAATPSQNEVATKDEAAQADEVLVFEVQDVSAPATAQEIAVVAPADSTMGIASLPEASSGTGVSIKSNKAILMGAIAAGLLILAAGGTWYLRRSAAPAQEVVAASAAASRNGGAAAVEPAAKNGVGSASASGAAAGSAPATPAALTASQVSPPSGTLTAQPLKNAPDKSTAAELTAYKKLAEPLTEAPAQPKKSGLGQFHLAAPAVNHLAATPGGDGDLAPSLGAAQGSVPSDSLGEGLGAVDTKQPAAPAVPLPVGGDVKQAHLISSTQPAYPMLAKSQHIEGNVRVDALVDVTGRVSSVHVVSGPALLHQSAMDAVRKWKYEPATLDAKPVPMHLTVTLQFRLQ
jgi:TonB family protein